jgi:hypothetical protein
MWLPNMPKPTSVALPRAFEGPIDAPIITDLVRTTRMVSVLSQYGPLAVTKLQAFALPFPLVAFCTFALTCLGCHQALSSGFLPLLFCSPSPLSVLLPLRAFGCHQALCLCPSVHLCHFLYVRITRLWWLPGLVPSLSRSSLLLPSFRVTSTTGHRVDC